MALLRWRLWIATSLPTLLNCHTRPPPLTIEAPRPPAQITVTPDRTPCDLPRTPVPFRVADLGGIPSGDRVSITTDGLAVIERFVHDASAWIAAASTCIGATP